MEDAEGKEKKCCTQSFNFQAGTDVNLTLRMKDGRVAVGLAASNGPPHEDSFSLTN